MKSENTRAAVFILHNSSFILPMHSEEQIHALLTRATKIHEPVSLARKWVHRHDPDPSVADFVRDLREMASSEELSDPDTAPAYAGWFMVAFLQRFERLVETGQLDDVLPRLSGLSLLYTPHAGVGAGEWAHAARLYEAKAVGTQTLLEYRGPDAQVARNTRWRHLAYDTVWVVQDAALNLPRLERLREQAESSFGVVRKLTQAARQGYRAEVYLLPGDELLVWPDWLNACAGILVPVAGQGQGSNDNGSSRGEGVRVVPRLSEAREAYLQAARAVLDSFFGDPHCGAAEAIVEEVRGVRSDIHRSQIVAEARKNVLEAVGRL
jgi:hypothetical protein